jgi:AmiR/NasT family two-component response regulator
VWPPATVVPAHTKVLLLYVRATDKLNRALTTSRLIGAAIGILMSALKINQDEAFHNSAGPASS